MICVYLPSGQWETDPPGVAVEVAVAAVEVAGGESDEPTDLTLGESVNLTDTVETTNRESYFPVSTLWSG